MYVAPTSRSYRQIIVENTLTFINVLLFGFGVALTLLGRIGDALISTGIISLNIIMSVVQEIRAKRTLDRIALLARNTATVLRDGRLCASPPDALALGDTLLARPGDQFVVDGRWLSAAPVTVDESLLTGDSDPALKEAGAMVYSGSFCVTGEGYYVAERIGAQNLVNQLTASARAFRRTLTPLQREIHLVVRLALLIVLYLEFLLAGASLARGINLADSVENSTIVAGLAPNGLFLSIAVAYALGALRILRFGALVQQSNAIESLSHVDILCLDKTGTLTTNQLSVEGAYPLTGSAAELERLLGALAASATGGDRTTEAIAKRWPAPPHSPLSAISFSAARRRSAVALDEKDLRGVIALGAPEALLLYLAGQREDLWRAISERADPLMRQGLRVLLLAYTPGPLRLEDRGAASTLPHTWRPVGLVSLRDELRPEAREALTAFAQTGVRLKIISGDSVETVAALARQAGMAPDVDRVDGAQLDALDDAELGAVAESATIFGRTTPLQKERLIRMLRQRGHYVAMIGDGVNAVLSLKQADLGIAMRVGSQAARGCADIVLMQDSFAVLAAAASEGQRILNGMQDILRLFLTRISTVGLVILSSLVFGVFPLELRQGSLVTLMSVGIPTILLAVWARPGAPPSGSLAQRLIQFILPPALITSMLGLGLFFGVYEFAGEFGGGGDCLDELSRGQWAAACDLCRATDGLVDGREQAQRRLATDVAGGRAAAQLHRHLAHPRVASHLRALGALADGVSDGRSGYPALAGARSLGMALACAEPLSGHRPHCRFRLSASYGAGSPCALCADEEGSVVAMETAGIVIAILCALTVAGLAPAIMVARRSGAAHALLCTASLGIAALALGAVFAALALGAAREPTGRFLMGIGVGVAVGLALCCASLLLLDWRVR